MAVALLGYQLGKVIYTGTRTLVYRGHRESDNQPVIIKFLRNNYPTFSELLQFRNQYTIAKNLNLPGIICPSQLESYSNSYALVMEDFGGISLREYSQTHSLELIEVLTVALQLAEILHNLHASRVIHKDIKPANILIHPESKQVKLIDFSIASLLPKETQEIQNPNILEGTLAYLAPEQTGRMNRGIDYRADFYALGVTLYELLTGQLPFESDDPMEMLHCHIAKTATPVDRVNSEVPGMVGAIVSKLMAKNAEDRYQSALGLKHDLQQCLIQWKETGAIAEFELGQRDICDRFLIPEKLYGREQEVQTLLDAFARVSQGISELLLVAGFSGIGKTAVVNEVHKPITRQKGYFIKGKFDQFNRNIPLSAFVQALRDLIGQLLSESDAQLARWKAQILEAVGENGQVLVEVIPELEQVIGNQPPAPELSGSAAQNRFNLLFQKFIAVFTTADHPLVVFLDDLQWADSASLQLLKVLMNDNGYLLVLGAYRDNEVSPAHPLMLTIADLQKADLTVNTLTLAPLSLEHTNCLVADTLKCSAELAKPLTQLVDRKTQGNPFFTTQFLKALYEDGYITFVCDQGYWQCDIAQVNALALTDDVVEFMALQLQKLPEKTQRILKLAACIGNQFDLATLAIVSEQSPTEVAIWLWKALQEGLILPTTQVYKFFQSNGSTQADPENSVNPVYRFLHDRVQQAAYSLIPDSQKKEAHLKVGQLLLKSTSSEALENSIFDIVNQFNKGSALITQESDKNEIAQLNLLAGKKAKTSTAYKTAAAYFTLGIKILPKDSWNEHYQLTFSLYREGAECEYLTGNLNQAERMFGLALKHAQNKFEKADIYAIQMYLKMTQGENIKASFEAGLKGLSILGILLPQTFEEQQMAIKMQLNELHTKLHAVQASDLFNLPEMTDMHEKVCMSLLADLWAATYMAGNLELSRLSFLLMLNKSLTYGNTEASGFAYSLYGMSLANQGDYQAAYEFGTLALKLDRHFNSTKFIYKTNNIFAHTINPYNQHLKTNLPLSRQSFQTSQEGGDVVFGVWAVSFLIWAMLIKGDCLSDIYTETEKYSSYVQQVNDVNMLYAFTLQRQFILNLQDASNNTDLLDREDRNDDNIRENSYIQVWKEKKNFEHGINWYCFLKLQLAYLYGRYTEAVEAAKAAEPTLPANAGFFPIILYHFYYPLSLAALYPTATSEEKSKFWKHLKQHLKILNKWANGCSENFLHRYLLLLAEMKAISGKSLEALELYDRAIAGAKENGYIQEEALANELAAKFYLSWGKEKVASSYMQEAYYGYARWGAKAKVADLEKRYPHLLQPILQAANQPLALLETLTSIATSTYSIHATSHKSSSSSINQTLDFASLLKISQTFASTIALDKLLQTLAQTMLENSGADQCALMLYEDDQWRVRMVANLNQVTLQSALLENNPTVPVKLIQYVKNTMTTVVIDDLKTDLPVIGDYLNQYQPKSVLCLPILNQGNLRAILYLENHSTSGVFTSDRILILNFLCTQAAISLENARLYQSLEHSLENAQQQSQDLAEVLALSDGQQAILSLIAQGVSLNTILTETARFIESHAHHPAYCSFLLIDEEGRLRYAAAPSLPATYNTLIDGIQIGPEVGSCGTAAYCKASVTVTDIATDPLWANYQVALDFGLRACSSTPILGAEGKVLATLAMYQPVAGEFTLHDRKLMEVATYLARIAIERHQADIALRNTQLQVMQSEKMSALGNLVAGVAHEINNPIGCIVGNVNAAQDYINDLLGLIDLYQEELPQPSAKIEEELEAIDLDYVREDLPKLIKAMKDGGDRITSISKSLRTFSRADSDTKQKFSLHDGIDSTVLILRHRLKANENRPAIEVVTDYGDLPEIACFPGQLNQVFMNILANAIDALDESNSGHSFAEIQANPNRITIETKVEEDGVKVTIADNGCGMPEDVKDRIFDHLFTTKGVGKGTGLGLAIARQIVEDKHGGKLQVNSQMGQGTELVIRLPQG